MATYTISINEKTALGKSILNLLKNSGVVKFGALSEKNTEYEEKVERNLGLLMKKSLKSDPISRDSVFKELEQ